MKHYAPLLNRGRGVAMIATLAAAVSLSVAVDANAAGATSVKAGLAAAKAAVAKYSKTPTEITITQPLPSKPKPGKSVVFLQCNVAQCAQGGEGFKAAATALGWKDTTLDWSVTEPASLVSDMQEALRMSPKPYAVSISGLPQAVWQQEEAVYAKAGVIIIPWSLGPVTYNKTLFASIQNPGAIEAQGRVLADWFIADSGGHGKAVVQDVSEYPSIDEETMGFDNEVARNCPDCSLTKLDVTGTEVTSNQVTSTIVSTMQANPSDTYVFSADVALAPGLPEALKAAGLNNVKVIGGAAISTDLADLQNGSMAAAAETNQYYNGWQMIDALARHAAGMHVGPGDGGGVLQILTKANVNSVGLNDNVPKNYPELFKKLWHVK